MKKILSIVLALAMLFTMVVPMTVFAAADETIAATGTTRIDLETYSGGGKRSTVSGTTISNSTAADLYVRHNNATTDPKASLTVEIAASGYYDITYLANTDVNASVLTFKLGDTVIGTNKTAGTVVTGKAADSDKGYDLMGIKMYEYTTKMYIEAATYTLSVDVATCKAQSNKWTCMYDYIIFTPGEAPIDETIAATGTTRIDLETYSGGGKRSTVSGTTISNSTAADLYVRNNNATTDPKASLTVRVAETGYYDITYLANTAANASVLTFKLGDTVIGTNEKAGTVVTGKATDSDAGYDLMESEMHEYTTRMYIEAATYTLSVDVATCQAQGGKWTCMYDYIIFEEAIEIISSEDPTTIEMEDYAVATNATIETFTGASAGEAVIISSTDSTPYTISIPVKVSEDGEYDIKYVASDKNRDANFSEVIFKLGDTEIVSTSDDTVIERTEYKTSEGAQLPVSMFWKRMELYKGEYNLTATLSVTDVNSQGLVDYIKFEKTSVDEYPNVSSGTFTVSNEGVVNADYTFTSPSGAADASVFKLKYNGEIKGSFLKGEKIEVPETVINDSEYNPANVVLEAIPIDEAGKIGVATKLAYINMTASYAAGAVTPVLTVVKGSSDFNGVLLVAFYAYLNPEKPEDGKYLLKYEQKHIKTGDDGKFYLNVDEGVEDDDWSAATTVTDEDYTGVVPESAEVFLLGCEAETDETNPIFSTTLKEYAYVGDITIG